MRLERLLTGIEGIAVRGDVSIEIEGLACHSRKVEEGFLFFALPGARTDGRKFIAEALARGARAVMVPGGTGDVEAETVIEAEEIRRSMAEISARFFGDPSRRVVLIGVTGTNGKTSFTYLMESILRAAGLRPGVIGTVSYRYGGVVLKPENTTPESLDLQRTLREMVDAGVTHVLLEVSSHGLDDHRVEACHFAWAVFTMLGRDHLDHHGTMERYFASKARLFAELLPRSAAAHPKAVLNLDDPYGRRLREATTGVPVLTAGRDPEADYRLEEAECSREGTSVVIRTPGERLRVWSPLLTEVNALNVLTASAVAHAMGIDPGAIQRGIEEVRRIPGRLDPVEGTGEILVLVDYAHTPDALERILPGVRDLTPGRLITVFGCGGDRDRGKRPLMGRAAARWSDLVVVTSDNPRSEAPGAIIEEILPGIRAEGFVEEEPDRLSHPGPGRRTFTVVEDRGEAIRTALRAAGRGDTVVIAGKGHEDVQIVGSRRLPFRDDEEVCRALRPNGTADGEGILGRS